MNTPGINAPDRLRSRGIVVAAVAWACVVVTGLTLLGRYKGQPGVDGDPPELWPTESRLVRGAGIPTLVMLSHPKCVCSRASLAELSKLIDQVGPRVRSYVVFIHPDGVSDDWAYGEMWDRAKEIDGVSVLEDRGAVEAKLFRAETSGQVLLYDSEGRLAFRGGVTSARGHEGLSSGTERILALVKHGDAAARGQTPVFGCPLNDSTTSGGNL